MKKNMLKILQTRSGHYFLILAVSAVTFFVNLGAASLWDLDEGRNATAAMEMNEKKEWVTPTFNGQLRVDKPALLYWLQILFFNLFGIHEFSARLPSALAALATLFLSYELGRAMFNPITGWIGALVLASTPMLCGAARFANPDALLNMCTVAAFFLFWKSYQRGQLAFVSLGIATGLGVLAKGPVGIVLPTAVILVFLAWNRQLARMKDRRLINGTLVFLLVALPWYIWVAAETRSDFLKGFFLKHNVERFLSPMENHRGGPLYYLAVLILGFTPWSAFLGLAGWYSFRSLFKEGEPGARSAEGEEASADSALGAPPSPLHAYRFLASWIGVYWIFFSLAATKLPNYVLPIVTPCALMTASFFESWRRGALSPAAWAVHLTMFLMAIPGIVALLGLAALSGTFQISALRERTFPELQAWAWIGLAPIAGAVLAWRSWRRQQRDAMVGFVTASALLFIGPMAAGPASLFNAYKAPKALVERSGAGDRTTDLRIVGYKMEYLPSLNFYCRRNIDHLAREKDIQTVLHYPVPVYLFLPYPYWRELEPRLQNLGREVARQHDFYKAWDIVVVSNRF